MIVKPNEAVKFPSWTGWTAGCRIDGNFHGKATVDNMAGTFTFIKPGSATFLVYAKGNGNQFDATCVGEPAQPIEVQITEVAVTPEGTLAIGGPAIPVEESPKAKKTAKRGFQPAADAVEKTEDPLRVVEPVEPVDPPAPVVEETSTSDVVEDAVDGQDA